MMVASKSFLALGIVMAAATALQLASAFSSPWLSRCHHGGGATVASEGGTVHSRNSGGSGSPYYSRYSIMSSRRYDTIVSPFDDSSSSEDSATTSTTTTTKVEGPLELTWENVELVLDEMRPFLIQDGGNVAIQDIDGPVVRLELQGNCGSCPSSTQTMKMGLERGLKEKIPEIQEVIQAMPEGPPLEEDQINVVLDGVRPFLQVAGGTIDIYSLEGVGGLQPTIFLNMQGSSASLNSVKLEIAQRLQRHFMMPGLRIEWVK